MLFLVKILKKGFKVELQNKFSPKLISQDRLTQELYLFAKFIKQRKTIFACIPAPRTLLILQKPLFTLSVKKVMLHVFFNCWNF
jgi:hypothetical protein